MINPPKVYLLPGLGFDKRIFARLKLPAVIEHIEWQRPLEKESISNYALRIGEEYLQDAPSILIGHSFGGIMALEMAHWFPVEKVILISSIRSPEENPAKFRKLAALGLHRLFNKELTLMTFPYWAKSFGYTTKEEQSLFTAMVSDQDNRYLQWALYQLSIWKGVEGLSCPVRQIHGDKDNTFPIAGLSKPDFVVREGTHMMVYSQAEEVGKWIDGEIRQSA